MDHIKQCHSPRCSGNTCQPHTSPLGPSHVMCVLIANSPTKADFIRAKYQFLAFVNKQKDSEVSSQEEYSKVSEGSV